MKKFGKSFLKDKHRAFAGLPLLQGEVGRSGSSAKARCLSFNNNL